MSHEIPRHWRLKQQRYNLVGEKCNEGHFVFPPRDVCPDCGHEAKDLHTFSGKGKVYSHTTIYEAPQGYEENTPFVVALIELEEGPKITAQLTDLPIRTVTKMIDGKPFDVREFVIDIGDPVEMVTRKLKSDGEEGLITYGYKFRPVVTSS